MTKSISKVQYLFIFGLPALFMGLLVLITKSSVFSQHQNLLSIGVSFDFIFSIPFIYYLIIRKRNIDNRTVLAIVSIGIALASLVIPKENQQFLFVFKRWIFPALELGILVYILFSVKRTIGNFKHNQSSSIDFFDTIKIASKTVFPTKISHFISAEIASIYYGFFARNKTQLTDNEYSYHKNSGTINLLYFIICMLLVESSIVHLLVAKYSNLWAWLLTGFSIYAAIQFKGFTNALKKRPIVFEKNYVRLNYGVFSETKINYCQIIEVKSIKNFNPNKNIMQLSPLNTFEEPNILIELSEENILEKLYGGKKRYSKLAFYVDEKEMFLERINQLMPLK